MGHASIAAQDLLQVSPPQLREGGLHGHQRRAGSALAEELIDGVAIGALRRLGRSTAGRQAGRRCGASLLPPAPHGPVGDREAAGHLDHRHVLRSGELADGRHALPGRFLRQTARLMALPIPPAAA
jgi:hypothetical protein